jgi:hypothetical protein
MNQWVLLQEGENAPDLVTNEVAGLLWEEQRKIWRIMWRTVGI